MSGVSEGVSRRGEGGEDLRQLEPGEDIEERPGSGDSKEGRTSGAMGMQIPGRACIDLSSLVSIVILDDASSFMVGGGVKHIDWNLRFGVPFL